jgi:hypothetical protein
LTSETLLNYSKSISAQVNAEDVQDHFAASLRTRDKASCIKLLDDHLSLLTLSGSEYERIEHLVAIGLTPTEIVDLILEKDEQNPWIYYDMHSPSIDVSDDKLAWLENYNPGKKTKDDARGSLPSPIDIKRKIAKLCGLAGIIPTQTDTKICKPDAWIHSDGIASITCGSITGVMEDWALRVFNQCLLAMYLIIKPGSHWPTQPIFPGSLSVNRRTYGSSLRKNRKSCTLLPSREYDLCWRHGRFEDYGIHWTDRRGQ